MIESSWLGSALELQGEIPHVPLLRSSSGFWLGLIGCPFVPLAKNTVIRSMISSDGNCERLAASVCR